MNVFDQAFQGEQHQPFYWHTEDSDCAALLVHGFPGTPADMRPVADVLHSAGWSVQGILLPGFGPQIASLGNRGGEEWFQAVQAALADLKRGYKVVMLVGYSMGGALALRAAAVEPPSALVLLAPFWKIDHPVWMLLPLIRRIAPEIPVFRLTKINFKNPEIRAGIQAFVPGVDVDDPLVQQAVLHFRIPVGVIDEIRQVGEAGFRSIPFVHAPVLLIQGTQDDLVLSHLSRRIAKRLDHLEQYVEVPAGHDLPDGHSSAWPMIRRAILDFADIVRTGNVR